MTFKIILISLLVGFSLAANEAAKETTVQSRGCSLKEIVDYVANVIKKNLLGEERKCPEEIFHRVHEDKDFLFMEKCALQRNDTICFVFGEAQAYLDIEMFRFVQKQAKPWKKYLEFVLVNKVACKIAANDYHIKSTPVFVFIKKDKGEVHRLTCNDKDYREKLNDYIEYRHNEDLKLAASNTVLFAANDNDFKIKLEYGQKNYGMVAIAFGRKSSIQDVKMFDFIQDRAQSWNFYARFLQVEIDKCPGTANKYHVSSGPVFVFQENDQIANRIYGEDYQEQLNDYIIPESRLVRAVDDADFEKRLLFADKNYIMVVIVFGDESVIKDKEMFKFVQKMANKWIKYGRFLKVDIKECDKTAEKFHITSGPAFVFRENFHEAHRIIDKDYKKELSAFINPMYRLLYAFNDAEFPQKLKAAKSRKIPVVGLVFGHGSSDSEMFKFVQINAVPWNDCVVFLKVDMDKCWNTPRDFGIETSPTFVFLRDDDVTTGFKRIVGTNYQAELNDFVGKRYCKIPSNV